MFERKEAAVRPLAGVVQGEALRALAESRIRPDPVRIEQGWTRRFVVEARRAPEYTRLYESLGYEVCADPVLSEQVDESCGDCRAALFLDFRAIYTRRTKQP